MTKACEIPGLKFETRGAQKCPVPHSRDFFLSQEWEASILKSAPLIYALSLASLAFLLEGCTHHATPMPTM